MAKAIKPKPTKYDEKLAINGSFEDVIRLSVDKPPVKKAKPKAKK